MMNHFKIRQYTKLSSIILMFIIAGAVVQYYNLGGDQSIFIITALIAVAPVTIFETWNSLKRPYVVVNSVDIIDFPKIVFDVEQDLGETFNNAICLRVYVENIGFETAIDCECESFVESSGRKFSTRWSVGGRNPITRDLSPKEEQFVDVFWYMYNGGKIAVPTAIQKGVDRGGSYTKSKPADLQTIRYDTIKLLIRGSNMRQLEEKIDILCRRQESLQEIMFELKEYNPFAKSVIEKGRFAIAYATSPYDWELVIPEGMNLEHLVNMPFLDEVLFEKGELKPEHELPIRIKEL